MTFVTALWITIAAELVLAFSLTLLGRIKPAGESLRTFLTRAPGLDLVVGLMTLAPPIVAVSLRGWPGLGGAIAGQILSLHIWVILHELIHREAARGPRLVKAQNRAAGLLQNHLALWFSVLALPAFWGLRLGEVIVYPPLRWLLNFPKYNVGDWINVSRHKYEGLVGHDLIWCLYCDWMTGVFSYAGEILRNVESFWCPLRFYDGKKCENCQVDFPDATEWATPESGSIAPAVALFEEKYGDGRREWFGHPARLTVEGKTPDSE